MKKIVLMILVLSILCLSGCKFFKKDKEDSDTPNDTTDVVEESDVSKLCEIAKNSTPTRIATDVSYLTNAGDNLSGYYRTTTDGTNVVFEYYYEKIATPAESLATGDSRRIVPVEGVIYYKDGAYSSGDGENWRPGTGTAFDLKLNFDKELFKNAEVGPDGKTLSVKFNSAELSSFVGTDLNANGDVTVTLTFVGQNLTNVSISCSTDNGNLKIENSYTYSKQDLSQIP